MICHFAFNLSALQSEHPNDISYPFGLWGIPNGHLPGPGHALVIFVLIFR
jgi:hypothetical protein